MPRTVPVVIVLMLLAAITLTLAQPWSRGRSHVAEPTATGQGSFESLDSSLLACAGPGEAPAIASPTRSEEQRFIEIDLSLAVDIDRRYYCPADFNKDDQVDESDLRMFLQAFGTREGPGADSVDVNGDGVVDADDLEEFLRAYTSPDCDPAANAAMRALSC